MKKVYKIILICAAVVALLVAAVALAISPIAKNYIEKHDHELLGRTIRMERLRANIFTGRLRIEKLRISGADDSTTFFSLDSFDMRIRLLPLMFHRVNVPYIHLTTPDVKVYQLGDQFNFDGILDRFMSDSTEVDETPGKPWEIGIYDIRIGDGRLFYKDLSINATWGLNDINLRIPGVYFSGEKTDVGAVLNFAEGGSLDTQVGYNIETSEFDIHVLLRDLAMSGTLPYFQQSLRVGKVDGRLSADVHLRGDANHLLSISTDGKASLANFTLYDEAEKPVCGVDTLGVALAQGNLEKMSFRFDRIYASGFSALFELDKEGNNLTRLIKESTTESVPASDTTAMTIQPTLHITDMELVGGQLTLRDHTLHRPFEYTVSDIRMRSRDFDPSTRNNLTIDARMQKTGAVKFRWEGEMDNLNNQNITVALSNIDLRDFSPYCELYTAYPLTNGNLTFRSQNVIRDRMLNGTNHLDMFEPKVDKKRKDLKPEMNIPLRLGLYVLKDKKGHVEMDLPVKGSLDSPEFSYRKIVMKAIGNVLLKVVTAPFSFLSGGNNNLEYIKLDPSQYAFTSEQYASFDKIGQMLQDKPEMEIGLTQKINLKKALPGQAANALRLAYANRLRGEDSITMRHVDSLSRDKGAGAQNTPRMTLLEYERILQTDIHTPEVVAFADSLLTLRGVSAQGLSADEKAMKLYREQALQQLQRLMSMRNRALADYMTTTHQAKEPRFKLTHIDSVQLDSYSGRDCYAITIGIEGENVEIGTEPDIENQRDSTALAIK